MGLSLTVLHINDTPTGLVPFSRSEVSQDRRVAGALAPGKRFDRILIAEQPFWLFSVGGPAGKFIKANSFLCFSYSKSCSSARVHSVLFVNSPASCTCGSPLIAASIATT